MKNMQAQTVILTEQNREESESVFKRVVQAGIEFKLGRNVRASGETLGDPKELMRAALPESGKPIETVLEEFIQDVLPHCYNFASPKQKKRQLRKQAQIHNLSSETGHHH